MITYDKFISLIKTVARYIKIFFVALFMRFIGGLIGIIGIGAYWLGKKLLPKNEDEKNGKRK